MSLKYLEEDMFAKNDLEAVLQVFLTTIANVVSPVEEIFVNVILNGLDATDAESVFGEICSLEDETLPTSEDMVKYMRWPLRIQDQILDKCVGGLCQCIEEANKLRWAPALEEHMVILAREI
eukprot:Gb_41512 [translate_table: standard]